jgi:enamine deaminase RidA (YjgF/YER057c/UK114 family)
MQEKAQNPLVRIVHEPMRVVREQHSPTCRISRFGPREQSEEIHLFVEPHEDGCFEDQLQQVMAQYHAALESLDLPRHTAVFRRCFLSDAANQVNSVMASALGFGVSPAEAAAVSCIEQPPLYYRKIALLAYHVRGIEPDDKSMLEIPEAGRYARTLALKRPERTLLWTTQMTSRRKASSVACSVQETRCALEQTRGLFATYRDHLASQGASLLDNALRTWVFVQNVDMHYAGMVVARRELFASEGLTPETHYIVATGIEGQNARPQSLITFDALAMLGLEQEQICFVDALDHLNRTDEYGVTFERSARLDHADRSRIYLAGTASIDAEGQIVHAGDVLRQTDRTLENMSALLAAAGGSLDDVAEMIVYLRDPSDAQRVVAHLDATQPGLPFVIVRASVCRPAWLVEMEGAAIVENRDSRWPAF